MELPFPFEPFLAFGLMSIVLLIGILLRAKVKIFQRFLIPSCLTGGLLGLIVLSTGLIDMSSELLEAFAYHLFIIQKFGSNFR